MTRARFPRPPLLLTFAVVAVAAAAAMFALFLPGAEAIKGFRRTKYGKLNPVKQRWPAREPGKHHLDPQMNTIEEDTGGQLLVGYSGNPWGPSRLMAPPNDTAAMANGRSKRGVVHLYNMVLCATGCNPLAYKGYGCYCGFLGSGHIVDPIDRCCKMHDWCYNTANCPMYLEYFIPYFWKCYRRRPICAIDHGMWGGGGSCAQRLCECDRQLAECLRRYHCPRAKAVCTSSPFRFLQNILL